MDRIPVKLTHAHNFALTTLLAISAANSSLGNVDRIMTPVLSMFIYIVANTINYYYYNYYSCTISQSGFAFMTIKSWFAMFFDITFSKSAFEHAMTIVVLSVWYRSKVDPWCRSTSLM